MFKMSKPLSTVYLFRGCMLFCAGVGLIFSLTPFIDFDLDGSLDSLVTDGIILTPVLVTLLSLFLTSKPMNSLSPSPQYFSCMIVPPPVHF
jgi:hypothetical protein